MTKVNEQLATEELNKVLGDWADGSKLPYDDPEFKKIYNTIIEKIMSGRVIADISENTLSIGADLVFAVPLGEALMSMTQDMKGVMSMAASMAKKDRAHFANTDARVTKTAIMIASLFMQV